MAEHRIGRDQPTHTRWDVDLEPVLRGAAGRRRDAETDDFAGGQITRDSTRGRPAGARLRPDLPARRADRRRGGRPGDALAIEIARLRAARLGLGLHHPRLRPAAARASSPSRRAARLRPHGRRHDRALPAASGSRSSRSAGRWASRGAACTASPIPPPHAGGGNIDCRHLTRGHDALPARRRRRAGCSRSGTRTPRRATARWRSRASSARWRRRIAVGLCERRRHPGAAAAPSGGVADAARRRRRLVRDVRHRARPDGRPRRSRCAR